MSGLDLPIKCFLVLGDKVGSCNYPDFCTSFLYILNINKDNCPQNFKDNGIDCTCPFILPSGIIELEEILESYSPAFLTNPWMVKGDYKIRVESRDSRGHFFCLNIAFTLTK